MITVPDPDVFYSRKRNGRWEVEVRFYSSQDRTLWGGIGSDFRFKFSAKRWAQRQIKERAAR